MKQKFYLLLLLPSLLFASCTKWMPDSRSNITGNWKITYVERQTNWGSEPAYTGYENGVFYFRNNESAQFSDNTGQMNGTWRMVQRVDGNSLELRLYDYRGDRVIEWEIYDLAVSGSRMTGYVTRFGQEYRFEFTRY